MSTDNAGERRFLLLKKRLDALHYCQPFGMESAALVEKLFNDLVKTTEGFQQIKKQSEEYKLQQVKNEQLLAPLRKENARLIQENNQLHTEIVMTREQCESKEGKWRTQLRLMEGERGDFEFMLGQRANAEKKVQEELLLLKAKLELGDRRGGPETNNQDLKVLRDEQKKWMEKIHDAQEQCIQFKEIVRNTETQKVLLEEKTKHLELQVDNREKEISRLKSKIDLGSNNHEKLCNDYQLQDQIQKVQRMQTQLDLLTNENSRLNNELATYKKQVVKQVQPSDEQLRRLNQLEQELEQRAQKLFQMEERLQDQNEQVQLLRQQLKVSQTECEELRIRSSKADQIVQAYQSDKHAFNKVVDSIKAQRETTESELEAYKHKLHDLTVLLAQGEERVDFLNSHVEQYQRERDIILSQSKRLGDELERERDSTQKVREQLRRAERDHETQSVRIRDLQSEIERLEMSRSTLEQQLERVQQDHFAFKSDADMTSITRSKLEQMTEALKRENELLRDGQRAVEGLLQQSRRDSQSLEKELNELRYERRLTEDQLTQVTARVARAETQLELKVQELIRMESGQAELQREVARLRFQANGSDEIINEAKRTAFDRMREVDSKIASLQQDNQQLRLERVDRDERIKQLEAVLQLARYENSTLLTQLRGADELNGYAQSNMKRVEERQQELDLLTQEVERMRENERRQVMEKEKQQSELRKNEVLILNGSKQVELLVRQKEDLMHELQDVRNELLKSRSEDHSTKNVSIKLSEKLSSQELAMQEMRELLQREQQRTQKLSDQLNEQKRIEQQLNNLNGELEAQVKQLRLLSEGIERSREELLQRLQNKNGERFSDEKVLSQVRAECTAAIEHSKALQQQLSATRLSLEQVDQERDEMQSALDEKSELCVRMEQRQCLMEEEIERQQSRLVEVQSRGDRGFETASSLEERLRDCQLRVQKLTKECENAKYTITQKEKELNEMRADLQVIARENHNLNNQLARINQEKELQSQQTEYALKQDERTREQLHLARLEMQDLSQNYEEVCAENQRLQVSLQHSQVQAQAMMGRIGELENAEQNNEQTMLMLQRREGELTQRAVQMEQTFNASSNRMEEMERQSRELRAQNDQLMREYNSQRRVSQGFQYSQDDLNRQMASLDGERQAQQEQIKSLKRDLESKEAFLEVERKRANDVEQVLMREREKQMRNNMQVEALRVQNQELTIELEKLQIRLNCKTNNIIKLPQDLQQKQDFGGISRVSASGETHFNDADWLKRLERKDEEINDLLGEVTNLRTEIKRLGQSSPPQKLQYDRSISEHSRLDSSGGWDKLRLESENFKKSMNQAAMSSQYLRMKMQTLQREYQGELGPQVHKF